MIEIHIKGMGVNINPNDIKNGRMPTIVQAYLAVIATTELIKDGEMEGASTFLRGKKRFFTISKRDLIKIIDAAIKSSQTYGKMKDKEEKKTSKKSK